jgi:predicted transcriptional regulator
MASRSPGNLKLEPQLEERVQRLATARKRSADWIMHEAVEQYVSRAEQREQFHKDTLAAWSHYEATGLHVTAEEADAWLAKLENGEAAAAPECHD